MNRVAAFNARLQAVTPKVFVAFVLIAINVAVFLVMVISGVDFLAPTVPSLLRWGANFGPNTIADGQWWRLVTSMFLHIGITHLAFNMLVFFQIGPFVERLVGNVGFVTAYFVSGIAGSVASLAWHPYTVSAGASGAIFGLYGVLLGFLLMSRRDSIPAELISSLSKGALLFLGYNVVYGIIHEGTDLAAHAGGLVAGFLCGLALSTPLTVDHRRQRFARNAFAALAATVLITGTAVALPHPVNLLVEFQKFDSVHQKTLATFKATLDRAQKEKRPDQLVADELEKNVLHEWVHEHDSLSQLTGLPDKQQRVVSTLIQYMEVRQQAWSMVIQGLRQHDMKLIQQSGGKMREADNLLKTLTSAPQ